MRRDGARGVDGQLQCRRLSPRSPDTGAAKGSGGPPWAIELALGAMEGRRDAYVQEMRQFGFDEFGGNVWLGLSHQLSLTGVRALGRHVALTLTLLELDAQDHTRDGGAIRPTRTSAGRPMAWASACAACCRCCATT